MSQTERHEYELILAPKKLDGKHDGVGCNEEGKHFEYRNCIVNMDGLAVAQIDEAASVTLGSSAEFHDCIIMGAAKLFLIGSGDPEKVPVEEGKRVLLQGCTLMDFVRRGPEVQDGMICDMEDCLIVNIGDPDHFCDGGFRGWWNLPWRSEYKWQRVFGAWAHDGGVINARGCVFTSVDMGDVPLWQRIVSRISHAGQAWSERGILAPFHRDFWLSGYKRALTAGPGGTVTAEGCFARNGMVIDNHTKPMRGREASAMAMATAMKNAALTAALYEEETKKATAWTALAMHWKERFE